MSGQVIVNYSAIYASTLSCKSALRGFISDLNGSYSQKIASINTMDSATNASLQETMEKNREKAVASANMLIKLADFISNAAYQVQAMECSISARYTRNLR